MLARIVALTTILSLVLGLACTPQQPALVLTATPAPSPTLDIPAMVKTYEAAVPTQTPESPDTAFAPALEEEWVKWVEQDSWTLCFDHEGEEAAIFHMEFELEPDATVTAGGTYLPLTLLDMNAPKNETLQYWFTPVPESFPEGGIDTPDDVIVPSEFTVEHPHYSFRASVSADQIPNLWEAVQQESLLLAVHGSAPGLEDPTMIGIGFVPFCGYTMDGQVLELPAMEDEE